jgi:Protein of unknown function (DUF2911)
MKKIFSVSLMSLLLLASLNSAAQKDKSKRPSPPATASQKVGEATITITYSQPSVKGRTIGDNLEPMMDKVWRAGANEATVFESDKDILVQGKVLPKGKYGFFVLVQAGNSWTLIFNKTWDQWGAFKYNEADDILRVTASAGKAETFSETLTYKIDVNGTMHILWGDRDIYAQVSEKK